MQGSPSWDPPLLFSPGLPLSLSCLQHAGIAVTKGERGDCSGLVDRRLIDLASFFFTDNFLKLLCFFFLKILLALCSNVLAVTHNVPNISKINIYL